MAEAVAQVPGVTRVAPLIRGQVLLSAQGESTGVEAFGIAAEDLRLATRHLGMIVGKVDVEEILGSIFNDFCIGK